MENLQWLIENGGNCIKLRMINEKLIDRDVFDTEKLINELLKVEKVSNALSYFDAFKNYKALNERELWGLVHNCYEYCFEQFMPFLINAGFKAGIPELDKKVEYMRDVYSYLMAAYPFHGLNIITLLMQAGYYFDDMDRHVIKRINEIHKVTVTGDFDIYEKDESKIRQPKKWKDKLILKDIFNPYEGELPLPLDYDIYLILSYLNYTKDADVKNKINDIFNYILNPKYQWLRGDYGWHWSEEAKTYHATSSGMSLPLYDSFELFGSQKYFFISVLEKMSISPVMRKADWFQKSMDYSEQYKTEKGTYNLPVDFIHPSDMTTFYSLYVSNKELSAVKRNGRKSFAFELYSTFFVMLMKKRNGTCL